jgi:hypothetical protein
MTLKENKMTKRKGFLLAYLTGTIAIAVILVLFIVTGFIGNEFEKSALPYLVCMAIACFVYFITMWIIRWKKGLPNMSLINPNHKSEIPLSIIIIIVMVILLLEHFSVITLSDMAFTIIQFVLLGCIIWYSFIIVYFSKQID